MKKPDTTTKTIEVLTERLPVYNLCWRDSSGEEHYISSDHPDEFLGQVNLTARRFDTTFYYAGHVLPKVVFDEVKDDAQAVIDEAVKNWHDMKTALSN